MKTRTVGLLSGLLIICLFLIASTYTEHKVDTESFAKVECPDYGTAKDFERLCEMKVASE